MSSDYKLTVVPVINDYKTVMDVDPETGEIYTRLAPLYSLHLPEEIQTARPDSPFE